VNWNKTAFTEDVVTFVSKHCLIFGRSRMLAEKRSYVQEWRRVWRRAAQNQTSQQHVAVFQFAKQSCGPWC